MKPDSLPIFAERQTAAPAPRGMPFLRLGFRPFYVGGALLSALIVPLWLAMFLGQAAWPPHVPPLLWHAHEMLFGFAVAIIVGFLLTAGQAWTGLPMPRGPWLGSLVLLWLAARVASLIGPYALYAVVDAALLPLVAAILVDRLRRAGNHRNLPLALLLVLLALANVVFHLSVMGVLPVAALTPLHAGLALVVLIECVMAGRVIPAFTMNATPGLKLSSVPWVERLTLALTALALVLWVFAPAGAVNLIALLLAAALQAKRWLGWRPLATWRRPILWILHASYAWIPLGLGLLGLAQSGWVGVSVGIHALAMGATGGLIIGMITRTARGHTGRALQVSKPEVLAYALVMGAAALRVLSPLAVPSLVPALLIAAGLAWSAAFLIYLWIFAPWLMQARLDGKDG